MPWHQALAAHKEIDIPETQYDDEGCKISLRMALLSLHYVPRIPTSCLPRSVESTEGAVLRRSPLSLGMAPMGMLPQPGRLTRVAMRVAMRVACSPHMRPPWCRWAPPQPASNTLR